MDELKKISDCGDLQGKYVLVRTALNVPVSDGEVVNQYRIARALPTLEFLTKAGARVIVVAHIGRDPEETLKPVYEVLSGMMPVIWSPALLGDEVKRKRDALKDGEVLMLENLRRDPREKVGDMSLAEDLASLADIFVQDAFAVGHREHASVVCLPKLLPSYAGINFVLEYEELKRSLEPEHPSLFILGGAKFETKMPLVEKFLDTYDHIFIGGALAHDMLVAKGKEIGQSLRSEIDLTGSPLLENDKILLPTDVVVKCGDDTRVTTVDDVRPDEMIMDAGPETSNMLTLFTKGAKTILWNGPLGNYELGFSEGTEFLAKTVAESEAYSVVGGGDTVASIESLGIAGNYGFLSTGGGAMLAFLEHGTLPAIEALKQEK